MASRLDSPFDLERCGPAVDLALEEVNEIYLKSHGIRLRKIQGSYHYCSGSKAPGLAADMYFKDGVIAFIGPACAFALDPVARLAAYWNTPIITGMGDQPPSEGKLSVTSGILGRLQRWKNDSGIFKDKTEYPTLTRMSYCQCRLKLVFSSIFQQFGWNHVGLILDRSDLFSLTVGKNLESGLRKTGVLSFVRELDGNDEEELEGYLKDASMYARVIILSVRGILVRKFMLAAYKLGMTQGDWTFLDVEIVQGSYWGDHDWEVGDEHDATARKAYGALLRVSLLEPTSPKFQEFSERVKKRALSDYNYTFPIGEEVNFFVGAFYDGVYLLGMALNETLTQKSDIRDGYTITRRMWSRDFHGITGHVRIDDNGDRDADYSVLDLNPETGRFEVSNYKFEHSRHVRIAADLNNMSWRIRPEEIVLESGKPFSSLLAMQAFEVSEWCSFNSSLKSMQGRESNLSFLSTPVFTTIGIYKGSRVAVKKIVKKKVDINKKLLWEIKQVRDVTHENTVRFIGSCISPPTVMIITEYCPRGSLNDVLLNKAIHLDWNFRMSLIHDIVKGMAFIHNSEVSVHGKLRSCNCLIDSRFVLKLSDFGLFTLTKPTDVIKDNSYYNKLLWVAPELLPLTEIPGYPATQKGDVYSFSIILEEIVVQGGPYQVARRTMEIQDILFRIMSRQMPSFRPCLSEWEFPEDLRDLMERCWADNPEERPSFDSIKTAIHKIMKSYCENLMDDLLHRMEQYANNLEALVEEKTEQLSLEKRRSEELLFQVLPRPVALQLMAGEMVQPEQFESVTIYFSDIVGFTALCASSTPMQVVDLLNDLYSTFDRIIGHYDVYKVETIGDAYMVVSGLPQRNGDNHAKEISLMALSILDALKMFSIEHRPDSHLKVRIGIHSGPVCAGVVGQKMPHYCLFGDTVNTASRMESTGLPLKIHVSSATREILRKFGTFILDLRGEVELKGKGCAVTYWLLGCIDHDPIKTDLAQIDTPADVNPYPLIFPELSSYNK
ncbi:hypothetical protein AAG570_007708 [Ranatra chinensis]|uniref:Guanylate cyclase n=1 Tax=Ranatra chinensis TaxID=642074 RepID=A0ABD0YG45_9HEMI